MTSDHHIVTIRMPERLTLLIVVLLLEVLLENSSNTLQTEAKSDRVANRVSPGIQEFLIEILIYGRFGRLAVFKGFGRNGQIERQKEFPFHYESKVEVLSSI